jgi:AsmA-like C-terminal region
MTAMRKGLLYAAIAGVALGAGAAIGVDQYVRSLGPRARDRVVRALQDRFDADVQLGSLKLTLFPRPSVSGEGLVIQRRDGSPDHPLISIKRFSAHSDVADLLWQRDRVSQVRLEGLEIHVPPTGRSALTGSMLDQHEVASAQPGTDRTRLRINIGEIVADGTLLEIEPKEAGKDPLRFEIRKLTLHSAAAGQPMTFQAKLMNAKPPGLIDSTGSFGPWQKDDPRSTAVSGTYTFQRADLSVFKGISGTLSSVGSYGGVLQRIDVTGTTDTPDFVLKPGGAPVHLRARFHSIVNGMDGETLLEPVDARFLNSEFICRGGVVKIDGNQAKTVDLYASTKSARIEDILLLITGDKKPLLTGAVDFHSKIILPPGDVDVLDRLQLDGQFKIQQGHFTSPKIEQRLETFSDRARGISKADESQEPPQTVASNFLAIFHLANGVASFKALSFQIPGAEVKLAGDYHLRQEDIDMAGVFRMHATLAETQSGVKHWLLKPLDPLFKKDGAGFQVPLKIAGNREHPEITVELFHHTFAMK